MAKRQRKTTPAVVSRNRVLKLRLSDEELKQVRVAAAVRGAKVSEFVREAVLVTAQQVQLQYLKQLALQDRVPRPKSED